jgi:hypothetical protein
MKPHFKRGLIAIYSRLSESPEIVMGWHVLLQGKPITCGPTLDRAWREYAFVNLHAGKLFIKPRRAGSNWLRRNALWLI